MWVSWTARRSNQSILKEISPEYSFEGLMLKLQYFGHLRWRTDSFEKTLMLGKIKGRRRRGRQRTRWLDGITNSMDMNLSNSGRWWRKGSLACFSPWGRKESDKTEQLNWTTCREIRQLLYTLVSFNSDDNPEECQDSRQGLRNTGRLKPQVRKLVNARIGYDSILSNSKALP